MSLLRYLIEDLLRNISGPLGNRLRYSYYKRRLRFLGKKVTIDTGVFIINPSFISVGEGCWIDKGVTLIAGIPALSQGTAHDNADSLIGRLSVGKYSHLGIGTVIQAHGGVSIGDYFTTSTHCRIYSYSNDPGKATMGTMEITGQGYVPEYNTAPVIIGQNVWLGLSVSVISARIEDNVFVLPHSVVSRELVSNSVAAGSPAVTIRKRFEGI